MIAKSASSSSGRSRAMRPRPLSEESTSSLSYQIQVTSTIGLRHLHGEREHHGAAALHVDGAATPQEAVAARVATARCR